MKTYWDTSALVRYYATNQADKISGATRVHSLAELFSALTGRGYQETMKDGSIRQRKLSLAAAVIVVKSIRSRLDLVELTAEDTLAALERAPQAHAQGGRIHDLLHAVAAEKAGADELWTIDRNDFEGLGKVPVKQL